jgi:hypothetical protein
MIETLEGEGILASIETPSHGWKVKYHFSITTETVRTPGFPPVASHSNSRGSVVALNGQSIPDGYYQLTAEDGEILRVKNMTGQWVILAPA